MEPKWKLLQYESENGRRAIDDWRKELPIGEPRTVLDGFLKVMAKIEQWAYPDIDGLTGARYKDLSELRWRAGRVPHRIIGYTNKPFEFIMLIGCTHNAKKYDPPAALETARDRKKNLEEGSAKTCEYILATDEGTEEEDL